MGTWGNVLKSHLHRVIAVSYLCHYTISCSHLSQKPARTHTHTHTHTQIPRSLTVGFKINCSISNKPLLYLKLQLQFSITELPLIQSLLSSSGMATDLWSHHLCAVLPLWCTWGWLPKQHPNGDERKLHFLWKSQIGSDQWCQRTSDRQQRQTGNTS